MTAKYSIFRGFLDSTMRFNYLPRHSLKYMITAVPEVGVGK